MKLGPKANSVANGHVLHPAVAVVHERTVGVAAIERRFQRVKGDFAQQARRRAQADVAPPEGIRHEGDVHEAAPRGHVPEVGHPRLVRAPRGEAPLREIRRLVLEQLGDRGPDATSAHDGVQPHRLEETLQPRVEGALNLGSKRVVALRARRAPRRIPLPRLLLVEGRRSARRQCADRLDSVGLAMRLDEPHYERSRRTSYACGK